MKLYRNRKAQSMLEYAILLAVIIAAFLLLQAIIKRGVSGGINEAAGRMGEQYSVSQTTTRDSRVLNVSEKGDEQQIIEETGTSAADGVMQGVLDDPLVGVNYDVIGSIDLGAHNISLRKAQDMTSTTESKTDSATEEEFRWDEVDKKAKTYDDYDFTSK